MSMRNGEKYQRRSSVKFTVNTSEFYITGKKGDGECTAWIEA